MQIFKNTPAIYAKMFILAIFLCAILLLISCQKQSENIDADASLYVPKLIDAGVSESLQISARSAIAIEAQSGEIYFEKNPHEKLPMASTTKIMTALVAIENCDIEKEVIISPDAIGVEGSSIYLHKNERLTLKNLLYALLLESANDAAAAIAIEIGGSIEGFADMMNTKSRELGLENTSFQNPHGLDRDSHYTTAYDLAKITMAAMQNPIFAEIVKTQKHIIPLNNTEGVRVLYNHNKLLKNYSGAIGVKTGFTKKSGRCLVSSAEKDGVKLICVTLNAPNDWQDHKNMLDLGFSLYKKHIFYIENEFTYTHDIVGGRDTVVTLTNTEPLFAILRQNEDITMHLYLPHFSYAPIQKGQIVGEIYYKQGDKIICSSHLVATHGSELLVVKKPFFKKLFG